MKNTKEDFLKIYKEERGMMFLMALNLVLMVALVIVSLTNLNPNASVVKVGYGDIGGYRDGGVVDILAFPVLAMILGVLHSLLAVKVYHKRGSGMAKLLLVITTILILGTFLVLMRLLGEG